MGLLHHIREISPLAHNERGAMRLMVALDGGFIGRPTVNGAGLRDSVPADRLRE